MKSVFLVLSACGALSNVSAAFGTCDDADGNSLLQASKTVHVHNKAIDAATVLKSMQDVANSLRKDSDMTKTPDEVDAALETANTALQSMFPLLAEQHANAQREINDAVAAVQACHNQYGSDTRAHLGFQVSHAFDNKEECICSLGRTVIEEMHVCAGQEDNPNCLCDEARTRVTDQKTLCASMIETYEVVFCERQMVCGLLHECHPREVEVYNALRADVEASVASRQQEYVTSMQANCLMDLIRTAVSTGTPIDAASLTACDDVDTDGLIINFPELPADPTACHTVQSGEPTCSEESTRLD